MGYIPPIKDDQFLIYTNRQRDRKLDLAPTPPTYRVAFYRTNDYHRNLLYERTSMDNNNDVIDSMKYAQQVENRLLGKGSFVDEFI